MLWLELATKGQAAHGGSPDKGDNAIAKMLRLLEGVQGFALPGKHDLLGGSTLNLGRIEGGSAVNVVPAACTAALDLRVPPPLTTHTARKAIEAAMAKTGVPYEATVVSQLEPYEAPKGPMVDRVRHGLREAKPAARVVGLPYTTEASVYQAHAPCLLAGPGKLDRMHVPDERVAAADLRAAARFYAGLLRAWA